MASLDGLSQEPKLVCIEMSAGLHYGRERAEFSCECNFDYKNNSCDVQLNLEGSPALISNIRERLEDSLVICWSGNPSQCEVIFRIGTTDPSAVEQVLLKSLPEAVLNKHYTYSYKIWGEPDYLFFSYNPEDRSLTIAANTYGPIKTWRLRRKLRKLRSLCRPSMVGTTCVMLNLSETAAANPLALFPTLANLWSPIE